MTRCCRLVFALAAVLGTLPVVAQLPAPPEGPVPSGDCDRCGKIESIRAVTAKDHWAPLGTVSTSPLNAATSGGPSAVTMVEIGPGFSKQGTVLIGAAGGAAYKTRPSELNAQRWEIVVRLDTGGTRSVTQNYEPMLREGDRVRVMGTQLELVQ